MSDLVDGQAQGVGGVVGGGVGPQVDGERLAARRPDESAVWMVKTDDGTVVPVAAETFLAPSLAAPLVLMGDGGPVAVFAAGEWKWAMDARAFAVGQGQAAREGS